MRLQVLPKAREGVRFAGRTYMPGEEIDAPDDKNGRVFAAVVIHRKMARKFEPTVVGTPTPAPRAVRTQPEPERQETSIAPMTTQTMPNANIAAPDPVGTTIPQTPEAMPGQQKAESPEPETEETEEPQEGDAPRRGRGRPPIHGRYARRDLRPEE